MFQKKLGSKSLALGVESKVKKLSKAKKEELISSNAHIDEIIKQVRPHSGQTTGTTPR
jgi:predicted GIY-YIG superfamily endonuclease